MSMGSSLRGWATLLLVFLCAQGCPPPPDTASDAVDGTADDAVESDVRPPTGWDSHTIPAFSTVDELLAFATLESPAQVKFVFTDFTDREASFEEFMDAQFYTLHDQWYWYRLLNGVPIPGHDSSPVEGESYATIEEILDAHPPESDLPLDLKYYGDRLYSPKFYADAFGDDRFFGLGSIVHFEATPGRRVPEEIWAFELEYQDDPAIAQLDLFFTLLTERMPSEVAESLRWLARSADQKEIAEVFNASDSPFAGRTLDYTDLVIPGNFEPYNTGISAGRVRILKGAEIHQATLKAADIVVLDEVPDEISPVAAIITGVPQTPLAHINLLAKSRGTPNMHLAGATDDEEIHDFDYFKKKVAIEVTSEGYRFQELSSEEYKTWLDLQATPTLTVDPIDLEAAPHSMELDSCTLGEAEELVGLIGGKAAHICAFSAIPEVPLPDLPMALSIRGFVEHIAPIRPLLEELFETPAFQIDGAVRYALLEGGGAWLMQQGGSPDAVITLTELIAEEGASSAIAQVLAAGGVRAMFEDQPFDPALLTLYESALKERFASLDEAQGLRFRSSSNIEDIEGFNGAGLYTSNTGHLYPEELPLAQQSSTAKRAILRTWSSFFGFGAFEERRFAGVDHLSGGMGVLVHPRFDNDKELSNGVFTLSLLMTPMGPHSILTMNAQSGAQSVTNPEGTTSPEVDQVITLPGEDSFIERLQASTLMPEGEWVLEDLRLLEVHDQALDLAIQWLEDANAERSAPQKESFLVLDFEYRHMDEGWPALQIGGPAPERFIWKQVRTLERPLALPQNAKNLPIPGDLVTYATHVDGVPCQAAELTFQATAVHTTADETFPFDYSSAPFVAELKITAHEDLPPLDLLAGEFQFWAHPALLDVEVTSDPTWSFSATLAEGAAGKVASVQYAEGGAWSITTVDGDILTGEVEECEQLPVFLTPSEFLKGLLDPAE